MNSAMLLMIFGLLLLVRTHLIGTKVISVWKLVCAVPIIVLHLKFLGSPIFIFMLDSMLCLAPVAIFAWTEARNSSNEAQKESELLDQLILQLKTGHSMRGSLIEMTKMSHSHFSILAKKIISPAISATPGKNSAILSGIQHILRSEHQQLQRLLSLRTVMQLEKSIRQKTRRSTTQVRAQMILLALIFFALLLFQIHLSGINGVGLFYAFAVGTFLLGMMWSFFIQRSFRWKI